MELADFTPITSADYLALKSHSWEGQTRVVDNHYWSCSKTADGQLVRTQSQNVPDSLLSAEKLAVSNAAKHRFDVVANGTTYQLTEIQLATADYLMEQYVKTGADCGSSEEVYERFVRDELGLDVPLTEAELALTGDGSTDICPTCSELLAYCPCLIRPAVSAYLDTVRLNAQFAELENLADMSNVTIVAGCIVDATKSVDDQIADVHAAQASIGPRPFVELGQSFDVVIAAVPYGKAEQLLTFEYRKSDSGNEYYDLSLDGKQFDGVFAKRADNIVTGLVGQFGYQLGHMLELLPEVLRKDIIQRVGVLVQDGTRSNHELMEADYTRQIKWSGDHYKVMAHKLGYRTYQKLRHANFSVDRAASAAVFAGSLTVMDQTECEELLTIMGLEGIYTAG